jgi:16S rRNA (cytosine1402-N4)-methyltransferase
VVNNVHVPVLLDKIVEYLPTSQSRIVFDGTFGGGGYSDRFLELGCNVFACDLDQDAFDDYYKTHAPSENLQTKQTDFFTYISEFEKNYFDFIVLDLGFSSNQLESSNRGLSYLKREEILDLRYDASLGLPCYQKIKKLKHEGDLGRILFTYSGEDFSHLIGKFI